MKSGLKRTFNWNKCQSKLTKENQKQYLDYIIDPGFQVVDRLFVLSFENNADRTKHTGYFLPKIEIKDYNAMIDGQNFLKNELRIYDNVRKIMIGHGDD